jgi:pSer/pThr/pTyr-binding forkhead associated (FHA) protein
VSRLHCRLLVGADGLVRVEDLGSVNGTLINGTPIHGLEVVRPGDRLGLGPVTFVVEYDKPSTLGGQEETHPPDKGDLRDFLIE